jgi:hypothetical protein
MINHLGRFLLMLYVDNLNCNVENIWEASKSILMSEETNFFRLSSDPCPTLRN